METSDELAAEYETLRLSLRRGYRRRATRRSKETLDRMVAILRVLAERDYDVTWLLLCSSDEGDPTRD